MAYMIDAKLAPERMELPPTPPDSSQSDSEPSEKVPGQNSSFSCLPPIPRSSIPTDVLDPDKNTPDSWLPRDPRLIRLTGVHPFNVEAPLTDLFKEGFLTSPELFYVRNHGPVPQVEVEDVLDWELSIEGLVENPFRLTLRDLLEQYEQRTYPITLVCAGNRRKEQNVVRKTKGFSWGPAGVSTALFTGVLMADLLEKARPKRNARYVYMEGADALPNGCYGTNVKLRSAMNRDNEMMIAHAMNGEMLRPDHGMPLRAVIPGQIGGRSVKWLKKIVLTSQPSDNWYHIWDNRVLPTMISPEESANKPSWWQDERYAIYDLSPNSAMASPAHDEIVDTTSTESIQLEGYAYSGGGRRITRVEISLDKGRSWRLADIDYPEDRYRDAAPHRVCGGMLDMNTLEASFCWCFWKMRVAIRELCEASDILVRAMDESMCIQPRDMYWSVLGMMNNPWFRVAIHVDGDALRFEHPTQPALIPGGWMERVKKAGGDLTNGHWGEQISGQTELEPLELAEDQVKMTSDDVKRSVTIEEVRKHDGSDNPWFVVGGEVYDGTSFLSEHPGGGQSIISAAGTDATEEFIAIHSEVARAMMPKYHIGTLDEAGKVALEAPPEEMESTEERPHFLNSKSWKKATLHSKRTVSWDSRVFSFKLEHEAQMLGLPIGQHLFLRLRDPASREAIIRSYTPISTPQKQGFVDVLVKIYFDGRERKGGKMSMALDSIPVGHVIEMKGPIGKFEYRGDGRCAVNGVERTVDHFLMICAGSGITPIFQVLRAVAGDETQRPSCVVLNGNRKHEDILCKDELDAFERESDGQCRIIHTLTEASDDWKHRRGRVDPALINEIDEPHKRERGKAMALVCGPEGFETCVKSALLEVGWSEDELLFF
jgi:nitrate reductase (NAD(P)H)